MRKTPSLADLPPRPLHSYFEYVGGGSSKFYAVSLEEEDGGTWRVRFNFGRIGFPRAWDTRVEGAPWAKAAATYMSLIDEKMGKGYEIRQWPATLKLPDGSAFDEDASVAAAESEGVLFRASKRGTLPPESGGSIGGVALPDGILYAPEPEGGSRGEQPVVWASERPVGKVGTIWARLAASFPESGIWPFVIDDTYGFEGFDDRLMDVPRGRHTEVLAILRKGWNENVSVDEDDPDEEIAPFGKQFPGLAAPTPGDRPRSIDHIVSSATGHLGLVALNRPADILDAVGWMGAANYDADPLDMTTVLRSWELRFDAYVVGMGTDTLTLAVGRPPRDLTSATAIAAEHFAFCPDNIQQGAGSIREYSALLVGQGLWPFWWD
jgi:predicted DNA-binding WGR domain protein